MTLRGRLAVAFTAILLAPMALGAAALAGLTGVLGRSGPDATADEHARMAVRAVVEARCRHLEATAAGLASTAALAGLSWSVVPTGAAGPWAICGVDPALLPAAAPTGLAARAEIRGPEGAVTGSVYAVQPLDQAFLAELTAAAGRRVSLLVAGGSDAYGQVSGSAIENGGAIENGAIEGGVIELAPDSAVPVRLWLDPAPVARDPRPLLLIAVAAAVFVSALLGYWLAAVATSPLRRLLTAVDRASAGDLSARSAVDGRDETGRLGRRLDQLIAGLQEMQRLSVTDALTGLGNRRQLAEDLRLEIERASRFGRTFGVLALDLDHFKEINDRYGHRVGDGVLVEFAARIRRVIREVDLAFRQGGEEFVILLPETGVAGSLTAARRIVDAVRDAPFVLDEPGSDAPESAAHIAITVSVGVAVFPQHGRTGPDLLEASDRALYAAKAAGRDTFVLAPGTQPERSARPVPDPVPPEPAGVRRHPVADVVGSR